MIFQYGQTKGCYRSFKACRVQIPQSSSVLFHGVLTAFCPNHFLSVFQQNAKSRQSDFPEYTSLGYRSIVIDAESGLRSTIILWLIINWDNFLFRFHTFERILAVGWVYLLQPGRLLYFLQAEK